MPPKTGEAAVAKTTEKGVDVILDKLELSIEKIENAMGSSVKLAMCETNALTLIEKARDAMMACVQDKEDKDRVAMTAIFGGDCSRISRMRAALEATKLSGKNTEDKRLPMCLSTVDIIERVLTEKGFCDQLRNANKLFCPFRPKGLKSAEETAAEADAAGYKVAQAAEAKQLAEAEVVEKKRLAEAKVAAEKAAKEAKAAAEKKAAEEKAAFEASQAHEKNVSTGKGTNWETGESDVARQLTVTISSELAPTFDFGPGGTMVMELPGVNVKIDVVSEPAWPTNAQKFPAHQEFFIPIAELQKVVFDSKNPGNTPDGTVSCVAAGQGELCSNIPEWMEVRVGRQTMAPWGSHKLKEGSKETELHYDVEVESTVAMGEGPTDDSSALSIGLSVKFTGYLTGAKSALFTNDGKERPAPVRQ